MRKFILIAALIALAGLFFAHTQRVNALQAHINKVKSDCASVEAQITLLYSRDDEPDKTENRDYFKLVVVDETTNASTADKPESITDEQTPYYWNTGTISTAVTAGLYNLEMWDVNNVGDFQNRLESYVYDCTTGEGYFDVAEHDIPTEIPEYTCQTNVPVYTTNVAPENGALVITWSYDGQQYEDQDWHVETRRVVAGQGFNMDTFPVPCFAWVKLYYQPDSTKQIYLMPSQYWPHGAYGAGSIDGGVDPNHYHTFFPLDGETKPENLPPTATPEPDIDLVEDNP
jgi:hypothetical protein